MNKPYSILMQKMTGNAPVKDSLEDFSIICTSFPFEPFGETKDLPKREWSDEDGEDTYIPSKLLLKAYTIEAELCYKGNLGTAYNKIIAFRNYLIGENGDGAKLKIYNSYTGIGRQNIYLLNMSDYKLSKSNIDDVLTFKVKFRICDPKTQIVLSKSI